jgi:hypothetical protein
MALKVTTIQQIDALDLEALIQQVYGRRFSVIAYLEGSNGSAHSISVPDRFGDEGDLTIAEWQALPPLANSWDEDIHHPGLSTIIDDLHQKGHIPAGEYQIHCWW